MPRDNDREVMLRNQEVMDHITHKPRDGKAVVKTEKELRAERFVRKLKKIQDEDKVILCTYSGTGDFYLMFEDDDGEYEFPDIGDKDDES